MLVEKVSYEINWRNFKKGSSFFIPCLDPPRARIQIADTLRRLKFKAVLKVVIEDGVRGFRVWRI
jgi:hypothetical protein